MRRLLYVTAVTPAATGNGRAMRCAMVLDALRHSFDVTVATSGTTPPVGTPYDTVHVFRLAAWGLAKPYLASAGARHLDLDDIESRTHGRIEALYRANGLMRAAYGEAAEKRRNELLEIAAFRSFERIYVCSEEDRAALAPPRCPAELVVLPNAVHVPEPLPAPPRHSPAEPFRFLFLGTMGYYPNFDAVQWFCREILPILRRNAPRPFEVTIAGSDSAGLFRGLPEVRCLGAVPAVAPVYDAADAVIVPLRAGGGTRIKILEAFSYRRPVVSTAIGAEGIRATPDVDILLGDSAEAFAARCAELMRNRDLADGLAENALRLVRRAYSAESLRSFFSSPPAAPSS